MRQRIMKILEYMEDMEKTHFEESDEPRGHIYLDVIAVREWLNSSESKILEDLDIVRND